MRTTLLLLLLATADLASAQHGFIPINRETTVSGLSFEGNRTFVDEELSDEVVTAFPRWYRPLLFWKSYDYTFRPAELQKDVHRIERFYHRQGFPDVQVDYVSKLDSAENKLDIEFQIDEGDPLLTQSVDFFGPDGRQAARSLLESQRDDWSYTRRDNTTWRIGERLALPELVRVQTEMTTWLRDNGYAFGSIDIAMAVDSAAKLVDVEFRVDPGPLTRIGEVSVEWLDGEPLVKDFVVRRQLPFKTGDLYSLDALTRGQRGLFNLNVFRFARVDMPDQPVDSVVSIQVRLQRSDLNAIRAETGYGFEEGLEISGEYIRRNFLGRARRLTISGILNTTIGERTAQDEANSTRRRLSVSLLQPYIFRRSMSALGSVFYDRIIDRAAQEEEFGGSADLLYEIKPYRTWSSGIQITRVRPLKAEPDEPSDPFVRGLFSSSATFGSTDDYITPQEGFLIRPSLEIGTPILLSDVNYVKGGISGTIYKRVGRVGGVALRLFRGRLLPYGDVTDAEAIESDRYDRARYYAGGSDDVRGWSPQLLGPKKAVIVDADTLWDPQGTLSKWLANAAYRFPLPFTPSELQWAIFADGAKLNDDTFRIGAGIGFRYQTPVGFIRFDVAYKTNPAPEDIRDARDVVRLGLENAPASNLKRFRLHFGIGQAF